MAEPFIDSFAILDGGLSTELERNGHSFLNDPLWSARLLHVDPEAIFKVHHNYLKIGAEIITTASYQASIPGFQRHLGTTLEESKQLMRLSVELAKRARDAVGTPLRRDKKILIAGSVGSYGAALADGSEYTGSYCDDITEEELIDWHRPRIECLVEAGADLLAFETIAALKEGQALMKLLKEFPSVKAWLSFSSQSMHQTSYGDDIGKAALACMKGAPASQLVAVGVNCCPPEYALSLLEDIGSVSDGFPLIVYPNSGEIWSNKVGWTGSRSQPNHTYLTAWRSSSAKIIGGCCRTTVEDTYEIYKYAMLNNL